MNTKANLNRKKHLIVILTVVVLVSAGGELFFYRRYQKQKRAIAAAELAHVAEVSQHYGARVVTTGPALLYRQNATDYYQAGSIEAGEVLDLAPLTPDKDTAYFYTPTLGYYISYTDVMPTTQDVVFDQRYQNYIPFDLALDA